MLRLYSSVTRAWNYFELGIISTESEVNATPPKRAFNLSFG